MTLFPACNFKIGQIASFLLLLIAVATSLIAESVSVEGLKQQAHSQGKACECRNMTQVRWQCKAPYDGTAFNTLSLLYYIDIILLSNLFPIFWISHLSRGCSPSLSNGFAALQATTRPRLHPSSSKGTGMVFKTIVKWNLFKQNFLIKWRTASWDTMNLEEEVAVSIFKLFYGRPETPPPLLDTFGYVSARKGRYIWTVPVRWKLKPFF